MTTPPPPPEQPPGGPPSGGPPPPGWTPPPPPGYGNSEEKTWALVAHFGGILVGFIAPLVVLVAKGNESPTLRAHAVESLNFQITWNAAFLLATIIGVCTLGILSFLPFLVWVFIIAMCVIAGIKANEGTLWTYPAKVSLVK